MPRPKENAPAPVQFNLQELHLGRRKFRSGTSGAPVQMRPLIGQQQPEKIPRYETLLCGKIMFGNKRFSFETLELDRSHANINKILKRKNVPEEEKIPTLFEVLLARTRAPLYSFQVKFEDVQSLECRGCGHEWELVLNLKKPPSCYSKTNGSSWVTVESPVASAKTIRCVTRAPGVKDDVAWKCGNEVPFAEARELAMQSSPMLAALFNGMPVEKEAVAPKRKANQDAPGNVSKRLRKEAMGAKKLSEKGEELLALEPVKESLNEYVKSLAHTVDMDWHDSYEETDEMLVEWFTECGDHVQKIIKAATSLGAGFGHAHEILKCIHDTWLNINAIPFRGCPRDTLSDADHEVELINGESLTSVEDMLQIVWPLLLARAASDSQVADGSLNQMLKDAHDNGVSHPEVPHESEPQLLAQLAQSATSISSTLTQGRRRLSTLEAAGAWKSFPCTVKKHRMRRCIDRRFDGPKHLRTRDYGSDSDDGFGCGLGGLGAFLGLF